MNKLMKHIKSLCSIILTIIIVCTSTNMVSYAESKIESIRLRIEYQTFESDSDDDESSVTVSLYNSSSHYTISETEITNMPSDNSWNSGTRPKLAITLESEYGYKFGSISSGDCTFYGDDVDYSSVKREDDNTTLILTVRLDAVDDDDDDDDTNSGLDVSDLEWDEDDARAEWTGADDAIKYYVKLYRNSSSVDTYSTTNTHYNLGSKISSTGTYYFKVRAYDGDDYGEWESSDTYYIDSSTLDDIKGYSSSSGSSSSSSSGPGASSSSNGAWLKDNVGWWYCNADRSYTINNWQYIGNRWYYFNSNGYMVTGWVLWKNIWYYLGSDGAMLTNATTPDGYRVDSNGAWIH